MNTSSGWAAVVIGALTATIPTFLLFRMVTFLFIVRLILGALCILLGIIALRSEMSFGKYVGWLAAALMLIAILFPFAMIVYHK